MKVFVGVGRLLKKGGLKSLRKNVSKTLTICLYFKSSIVRSAIVKLRSNLISDTYLIILNLILYYYLKAHRYLTHVTIKLMSCIEPTLVSH